MAGLGALTSPLVVASEARAQAYTGSEVKLAVDPSIDIMKDHVSFLALQDRYDAMLGYFVLTERFSPLRYVSDDGTKTSRVAHRAGEMIGGGYGTPQLGFMAGAWIDWIRVGPGPSSQFQGIIFGGVALYGFQATYSSFQSQQLELDPFGNFGDRKGGSSGYTYRPGAGEAEHAFDRVTDAFTVYHSSGASLVVLRAETPTGASYVSDVRAQLQPLKQWLDDEFGLPIIAVQKLDPARALADARTSGAQALTQPDTLRAPWEIELGSDNLLNQGIRAHVLGRVSPTVSFRSAELGVYRDIDALTVAARTFAFSRDDRAHLSLDAFARYSILPPGKESLGFPVAVAASYSYDSPDASTFIPLPYAHVFGLQIIVGAPDIAKPVVPIVRPKKPDSDDDARTTRGGR
ncbi:MAG: hypothetical protein OZ921_04650 [Sorangiineae bacterium]|nr:hypothetical protein [Polyangiaceae bacterium]MEB2321781.1 hypothetical protein [Sorangiineae bacterium]